MSPTPDVSVIVVAWNGRDILLRCLEALHREPQGVRFETIVVDNASSDGAPDAVARAFPAVILARNAFNRGFARAVNQGLARARGRVPVLLNPDTLPGPGLLERLVRYLDASPDAGLAGVQLLHEDGSLQNSIDNDPRLLTEIVPKGILRRCLPRRFPSKRTPFSGPTGVETVIGACMAIRREAMEQAGVLDEGYFLFLEETDWCGALRRAGWRVVHLPEARLIHLQGKSKDVAPAAVRIEYLRSLFRYFRKNRGVAVWFALRAVRLVRTAVDWVGAAAACLGTALRDDRRRMRLRVVSALLSWQARGCPEDEGLQSRAWLDERPELAAPPVDAAPVPALGADALADLDALGRRAGVETLKDVRIKRLFRIRDGSATWLVKVYRARRGASLLRAAWSGTRAEHEDAVAREAARRGVPTLVPDRVLVRREAGWPRESAVVHRERAAVPLDRFLREERSRLRRCRAIEAYARLARRMHDTGVHQDDLDPNNALLEWVDGRPQLWLIDHERVTIRPPLGPDERTWSLAKLHRFTGVSAGERARFLRAYAGARAAPGSGTWRELARRVLAEHRNVLRRDFARAARAAERPDRNLGVRETAAGRLLFRRRLPHGPDLAGVDGADGALPPAGPPDRRTEIPVEIGGRTCAGISWSVPSATQAREIWAASQGLLRVRAPVVPLILARLERGSVPTARLLAADEPGSRPFADLLAAADSRDRIALAAALGHALGRLAHAGVGFPFLTAPPPVFPDFGLVRVSPSGAVRFLPFTAAEALPSPRDARHAADLESVRAWAEALEFRAATGPAARSALAQAFARAAGVPARAVAAFLRAAAAPREIRDPANS